MVWVMGMDLYPSPFYLFLLQWMLRLPVHTEKVRLEVPDVKATKKGMEE